MTNHTLMLGLSSFITFSVAAASSGFAQDSKTPFETLKAYYESSPQAASVADIDQYNDASGIQVCVLANEEGGPIPIQIARWDNVVIPGEPSNGPLFPGAPNRIIPQCFLWEVASRFTLAPQPSSSCANQKLETTGTDMRASNGDVQFPGTELAILFRKNGDTVSFRYDTTRTNPQTGSTFLAPIAYGYCYRK